MSIRNFYEAVHGDYEDMLLRLPTDELILKFVLRFPADGTYNELIAAVEAKDTVSSFEAAHKLKGLVANLGFTELYKAVSALTEQLRPKMQLADPELLGKVKTGYATVIGAIKELESEVG